jgi:hypothetical protein
MNGLFIEATDPPSWFFLVCSRRRRLQARRFSFGAVSRFITRFVRQSTATLSRRPEPGYTPFIVDLWRQAESLSWLLLLLLTTTFLLLLLRYAV